MCLGMFCIATQSELAKFKMCLYMIIRHMHKSAYIQQINYIGVSIS